MTEEIKPFLRYHFSISRILLGLSVLLILTTVIASIFARVSYGSVCICTINYLAYAWIAFAITSLIALATLISAAMANVREKCCRCNCFINILLWLQAAGFMAGLILLLIFITRFTEVIG